MHKAYSYLRFSTADQIHGDSLRRQTTLAKNWCQKNGIPLVENYRDLGVSAFRSKNADKGALKAFLSRVESGAIEPGSYLIVESLDRLSRTDITYALQMFLGIINAGIVVVTLADERVYDKKRINDGNFTDLIISLTILSRANEESRIKSMRSTQAWEAKRGRAGTEKITALCPGWLKLSADRKKFEVIPEKAKIVKRIFQMAAQGKGGLHIAQVLQRENVSRMGKGSRWYSTGIKNILDSRAVIGEFQLAHTVEGKRVLCDPVTGYYPAVVPMDLYSTVQRIRRTRSSYRGRGQGNPIAGLLYNVMTGRKMMRLVSNEAKGYAYLVDAAAPVGAAPRITWHYGRFLEALMGACEAITTCPPSAKKQNQELEDALKRKDEIEAKIPRLVDFISDGFSAGAHEKLRLLEAEKKELESRIAEMKVDNAAPDMDLEQVDWRDASKLKENARAIIERIEVHPQERWFTVKTFDGREVRYTEEGGSIEVLSSEPVSRRKMDKPGRVKKSRSAKNVKRGKARYLKNRD